MGERQALPLSIMIYVDIILLPKIPKSGRLVYEAYYIEKLEAVEDSRR